MLGKWCGPLCCYAERAVFTLTPTLSLVRERALKTFLVSDYLLGTVVWPLPGGGVAFLAISSISSGL
jgi:hypothetical protein